MIDVGKSLHVNDSNDTEILDEHLSFAIYSKQNDPYQWHVWLITYDCLSKISPQLIGSIRGSIFFIDSFNRSLQKMNDLCMCHYQPPSRLIVARCILDHKSIQPNKTLHGNCWEVKIG